MKKIVFVSGLVLIAACVYFCKSCGGNRLNGKEFDCYDEGLRALITFEQDSTVVCSYSSFDFVASIFKMNENRAWIRVLFAKWAMLQIAPVYLCIRYFIYVLLFYIALYLSVRFYRKKKRVK